ncbi:MAG: PilZ domain-containing protein [Pseudomonadota bacterium]
MALKEEHGSEHDARTADQQVVDGELCVMSDRRALRRRVIKGVRISFGNDYCAIEGAMKNVSETGALVQLKDGYLVPDNIVIYNELEGYKVSCVVVRREAERIGVRFTSDKVQIEASKTQFISMLDMQNPDNHRRQDETVAKPAPAFAPRKGPVFGKLKRQ